MAGRNAQGMHRGRNSSDLKSVHGDVRMRDASQEAVRTIPAQALFDGIVVDEIVEQGINCESCYSLDTCLARDVLAVSDDSVDGNIVIVSDFLVEHALCDTHQNLLPPLPTWETLTEKT